MASKDGIITRKDIIEDDALNIGSDYAKNMQQAIDANNKMIASAKELNAQIALFRGAKNQEDYISAKQRQALETQKVADATRLQEAAEISIEKIAKSRLATQKAQLELDNKVANAKKTNTKLTIEERIQNEINNRVLKQEALERMGLVGAYARLNARRTEAKKVLLDLMAAETKNIEKIKEAQKAFDELDRRIRAADQAARDFSRNVGNYPQLDTLGDQLRDLIGAFGITTGLSAFGAVLMDAFSTMNQFEQSLADLSSITGASGKDLDFLRLNAIELGKGVKGGAIAVVEAYKLIAGAKPELLDNVKALNAVTAATITLAQAAGMELPDAATALTDAMNQFGVGAEYAQEFIDALANGAKFGSAEIPQLTESLLKFGAVARSANISIHESAALVELLAENGIKGAEAGTALRNVLLKISAPDALPKEAKKALMDLGISFDFLKDKTVPIQDKFEALKPLLKDSAKLLKVFGFENVVAAQNIIEHTDRLGVLTSQMSEFGTAEEQAAVRMDTVNGKTEKLVSTYDALILSVGNGKGVFSEFFKLIIDGSIGSIESLIRLNKTWDEIYKDARSRGEALGEKEFQKRFNSAGFLTDTEAERAVSVLKTALAEYNQLKMNQLKIDKEIASFNPYLLNFGKSGKQMKKEKEQIELDLAARFSIIQAAMAKIKKLRAGDKITDVIEPPADSGVDKDALKRAKALNDALYELEKQRLERAIKINNEIAADELLKDDIRIKAVENSQAKELALTELTKQHKLDFDKFVLNEDKLNANQKLFIAEEAANKTVDINKNAQKAIEKIRLFDEESYKKSLEKRVSRVNESMNKEIEEENNRFREIGDLESMTQRKREKAIEEHERRVFEIRKKGALAILRIQLNTLQDELDASDLLSEKEALSATKRQEIAEKLSKAKADISEVENSRFEGKNKKEVDLARQQAEQILEISNNLTGALADLGSGLFERRIQNIQEEIDKNNEYYDNQIELAGEDEKQKDLIEKEREKKNKALEDRKKKEQHKQAVFNKAAAIAQATISTALAVLAALSTQPFLPLGPTMATLAGVLGAIQIGAIIATPIPKYKLGRKDGPKEKAIVGDGGVHEVIERKSGEYEITPNRDTLVQLEKGDKVHSSIAAFKKTQRKMLVNDAYSESKMINEYQKTIFVNENSNDELVKEMILTRKAIERNKPSRQIEQKQLDISHAIWKLKNTNWNG